MATEVIVKKWGNSVGVLFPKRFVEEKNIKVNDKIEVEIVKKANLNKVFNTLKRKMDGQEFKDMVRKGWK